MNPTPHLGRAPVGVCKRLISVAEYGEPARAVVIAVEVYSKRIRGAPNLDACAGPSGHCERDDRRCWSSAFRSSLNGDVF